jgi:ABC-type nickel/cobalt efflux system permease component RcnA
MGLELPSQLVQVLNATGYMWPETDETKLFDLARHWSGLAADLPRQLDQADRSAGTAWQRNSGATLAAYQDTWGADHGPSPQLRLGTIGSEIISAGLVICAGAVLALKLAVVAQLVALAIEIAQAIATAVVTGGASLLEIPVWQISTRLLLNQLLNQAIDLVLQ